MLSLSFEQISTYLFSLWLPFLRISGVFILAPIFGDGSVPMKVRVLISIMLTVVIAPLLPLTTPLDPFSLEMLKVSAIELLWGILFGFIFQILFAVFTTIGQTISMQMGLAMAVMNDPANGVSVAILGRIFHIASTLLFLAMDGHIAMLVLLKESFGLWPVNSGIAFGSLEVVIKMVAWMFVTAFAVALPAIAAMLISNTTFGFMSRAAPSFNIFALGFPMTMTLGLFAFFISISNLGIYYNDIFLSSLQWVRQYMTAGS